MWSCRLCGSREDHYWFAYKADYEQEWQGTCELQLKARDLSIAYDQHP